MVLHRYIAMRFPLAGTTTTDLNQEVERLPSAVQDVERKTNDQITPQRCRDCLLPYLSEILRQRRCSTYALPELKIASREKLRWASLSNKIDRLANGFVFSPITFTLQR